jgi:hypothetical protein
MVMEGYDQETLEDVQVSQGPPFMGSSETIGHTHKHGDSRAKGNYEDTSICVPGLANIHIEVDATIHHGYVMSQEDTKVCMSIEGHMMM